MAFTVHRAERADLLAEGLADLLRQPLDDPFATELVIVPAKGIERWLSQRLSHRLGAAAGGDDGVCAGVDFASPGSLIAAVLGVAEEDPWAPGPLSWSVLRAIDTSIAEPWAAVLAEHLGQGRDGVEGALRRGRRLAVARRLALNFAGYAAQRPALLADWETGGAGDGGGRDLPVDLAWQPPLWRQVVAEVAATRGAASPTARLEGAVAALSAGDKELDLPPRISLFGHTRLSRSEAALLAALGSAREVHLWLPHPSPHLWEALRDRLPSGWREEDRSHLDVAHPLLASMGRDLRETQAVLAEVGAEDHAMPAPARPATVLGHVQSDLAANTPPRMRAEADRSIQVHACHGPARQVEVLREVILGLLADDPTLEPRDIVVMCPDIEEYAPLISGAFGLGDAVAGAHPGHSLRVMLADRSPQQTNPLLGTLAELLELADGRAEASRVLDLLSSAPVRRRFGFSDNDLETLAGWIADAGIRWAWDAPGREQFGLAGIPQNTWRFGLDRILAGVALSDDSGLWLGPTLPLDDVSTTDISLAGRAAEAIDRLQALTGELAGEGEARHWLEVLADGVAQIADVARGEEWQLAQLRRELAALGEDAGEGLVLRLPDVRALLRDQLAGRPSRASFRTGTLTVCTMTPMRSVPHRVVCLLGLDDGIFPRGGSIDGDDVLARLPMVGERDVRSQDRQLFLDAVMAATEHLVITYTGFSETTGQPRPPAVPLREFLDVVEQTTPERCVREHRSQGFHADYLLPGAEGAAPFSFDPDAARAARAAAGERDPVRPLAAVRAEALAPADLDLRDVIEAVANPIRFFLRRRLEIDLPRSEDEIADAIPVALDGLQRWQVGDRLLREILGGRAAADAIQAEWRRGTLPPGQYGWRRVGEIANAAQPLAETFEASTQGMSATARDLDLDLPGGRRLTGSVGDLYGQRLVRCAFSRLGARHRLEAWVSLVALSAAQPGPWVARHIGRAPVGDAPARVTFAAVEDPAAVMAALVEVHDLALTRVLPYGAETARAFAKTVESTRPRWMVENELRDAWRAESRAVEVATAWGRRPSWEELSAEPGSAGGSLFEELALKIWAPLVAAEVE